MARYIAEVSSVCFLFIILSSLSHRLVQTTNVTLTACTPTLFELTIDASIGSYDSIVETSHFVRSISFHQQNDDCDTKMTWSLWVNREEHGTKMIHQLKPLEINDECRTYRQNISFLKRYKLLWFGHIERTFRAKHWANLVDADVQLLHVHLYRARPERRHLEKPDLEGKLKECIAEPRTTGYAWAIVFTPREKETITLWVQYLRLYAMVIEDKHPVTNVNAFIDCLDHAWRPYTPDANAKNSQVELDEGHTDKTVFATHYELYC